MHYTFSVVSFVIESNLWWAKNENKQTNNTNTTESAPAPVDLTSCACKCERNRPASSARWRLTHRFWVKTRVNTAWDRLLVSFMFVAATVLWQKGEQQQQGKITIHTYRHTQTRIHGSAPFCSSLENPWKFHTGPTTTPPNWPKVICRVWCAYVYHGNMCTGEQVGLGRCTVSKENMTKTKEREGQTGIGKLFAQQSAWKVQYINCKRLWLHSVTETYFLHPSVHQCQHKTSQPALRDPQHMGQAWGVLCNTNTHTPYPLPSSPNCQLYMKA